MSSRSVAEVAGRGAQISALPNLLSLLRIGLVPVIVIVLFRSDPVSRAWAGGLFLIACLTDFFDGWIARRHGITTTLGQFLDPDARVAENLHGRPGPERFVFFQSQVPAFPGFGVLGPGSAAARGQP